MGSQVVTSLQSPSDMVAKTGGNWKRPTSRMYTYNFQIGENYYLPMTSYLETKTAGIPGPLCFSERIAIHPLSGTSISVYTDQSSVETIKKQDKSSPACRDI